MSKYTKWFGSWTEIMTPFLESPEWKEIGKTINPLIGNEIKDIMDIFRPFLTCPFDELKVVLLTHNPFKEGQYNGIPFGSYPSDLIKPGIKPKLADSKTLQMLDKVLTAVKKDYPKTKLKPSDLNLERWCKQGVFMLNVNPTTGTKKGDYHLVLWKPFITYLMGALKRHKCGIIYVLAGEFAKGYRYHINLMQNDVVPLEHPIIAMKEVRDWNHQNVFQYINRVSLMVHNKKIQW